MKTIFLPISFIVLVNACIFSSEQEEGKTVTKGVKDREKGDEQLYALRSCLSMLTQQRKRRVLKTEGGNVGDGRGEESWEMRKCSLL